METLNLISSLSTKTSSTWSKWCSLCTQVSSKVHQGGANALTRPFTIWTRVVWSTTWKMQARQIPFVVIGASCSCLKSTNGCRTIFLCSSRSSNRGKLTIKKDLASTPCVTFFRLKIKKICQACLSITQCLTRRSPTQRSWLTPSWSHQVWSCFGPKWKS